MKAALFFILILSSSLAAQHREFSPLIKLFEKNGLEIYFIYYSEGNGIKDNGVVIFLANKNDYPVSYQFNLLFRAGKTSASTFVSGRLKTLENKTGSNEGLYFIPFRDKRSITEVGISGCKVEKL